MFTNKTIIVTGASHGIGKSIATHFATEGARVIGLDIQAVELKDVEYRKCDVGNFDEVISVFQKIHEEYGAIHALINNAGISNFKSIWEVDEKEWDSVLNTNLKSVFICSREAARYMTEDIRSIINMTSTRAFMSEPNTETYSASKGGIYALTHSLAATFSEQGIRVNSIAPGWIHTGEPEDLRDVDHQQHWSGRVGNPADVARACLFLSNPQNSFISGECLNIDGGMTRKMIYEH
ncbi:3-oxoacyl-[acyl-carrier protein] reductase [Planococcus halocryophilus Or1]|uniref:Oxidoreductase n=1 Tax=Planococcus halocryophilus TaxID=1215089 RepID=A0A1C7DQ87_9BACL|nr:SDR family oxidoreductase [Planococcus halocryophilus]ANU13790.1 oxidoreductase [Planococcus halocryophilus]EMF46570.1 3-oxoacyl-[acyl-carrier protein] reductase [Planococcus halocryophilus Or1]